MPRTLSLPQITGLGAGSMIGNGINAAQAMLHVSFSGTATVSLEGAHRVAAASYAGPLKSIHGAELTGITSANGADQLFMIGNTANALRLNCTAHTSGTVDGTIYFAERAKRHTGGSPSTIQFIEDEILGPLGSGDVFAIRSDERPASRRRAGSHGLCVAVLFSGTITGADIAIEGSFDDSTYLPHKDITGTSLTNLTATTTKFYTIATDTPYSRVNVTTKSGGGFLYVATWYPSVLPIIVA